MQVSNNYICVEKLEEQAKDGFQTVEVTDPSLYKGRVTHIPASPVFMGNRQIAPNDVVLFAKYSPDTHDIEHEGKKYKFVSVRDLLAVL